MYAKTIHLSRHKQAKHIIKLSILGVVKRYMVCINYLSFPTAWTAPGNNQLDKSAAIHYGIGGARTRPTHNNDGHKSRLLKTDLGAPAQ